MLRHGARTRIGRQFVSYPFHLTRPFTLDAAIPELLTIYQQSCSGGLYRGEQLTNRFTLEANAAAHITTQSATIVHDCHGQRASQDTEVVLENGAFLALMPEPLVLFPGASCALKLEARISRRAVLMMSDAFARHDPFAGGHQPAADRAFAAYESDIMIQDFEGHLLARDLSTANGATLSGPHSPVGDWSIISNFILAGDKTRLPTIEALTQLATRPRLIAGVTELPNRAGWGVRCLARDSVAARGFADSMFELGVRAAFGEAPAARRK